MYVVDFSVNFTGRYQIMLLTAIFPRLALVIVDFLGATYARSILLVSKTFNSAADRDLIWKYLYAKSASLSQSYIQCYSQNMRIEAHMCFEANLKDPRHQNARCGVSWCGKLFKAEDFLLKHITANHTVNDAFSVDDAHLHENITASSSISKCECNYCKRNIDAPPQNVADVARKGWKYKYFSQDMLRAHLCLELETQQTRCGVSWCGQLFKNEKSLMLHFAANHSVNCTFTVNDAHLQDEGATASNNSCVCVYCLQKKQANPPPIDPNPPPPDHSERRRAAAAKRRLLSSHPLRGAIFRTVGLD